MLARLVSLLAAGEASAVKRRIKTALIAYLAAALCAVLALAFLVLAAYLAAAVEWGAFDAAIFFGLGFVALTGVILLVHQIVARAQQRELRRKRAADATTLAGASALALLPSLVSRKGGTSVLLTGLAALAGYAAYREYHRRSSDPADEN